MAQQLSLRMRPRRFADMIDQEAVTDELANYYVDNSDLPVALMFTGPSGRQDNTRKTVCCVIRMSSFNRIWKSVQRMLLGIRRSRAVRV